jgi:hypothetical protein
VGELRALVARVSAAALAAAPVIGGNMSIAQIVKLEDVHA